MISRGIKDRQKAGGGYLFVIHIHILYQYFSPLIPERKMIRFRNILFSLFLFAPFAVFGQAQFDVFEAGIAQIQNALGRGQVSSVQLVQQYLDRIQAYDR